MSDTAVAELLRDAADVVENGTLVRVNDTPPEHAVTEYREIEVSGNGRVSIGRRHAHDTVSRVQLASGVTLIVAGATGDDENES